MRWDYSPLDINPVFPGLGEVITIIIIIIIIIIIQDSMLFPTNPKEKREKIAIPTMWK